MELYPKLLKVLIWCLERRFVLVDVISSSFLEEEQLEVESVGQSAARERQRQTNNQNHPTKFRTVFVVSYHQEEVIPCHPRCAID